MSHQLSARQFTEIPTEQKVWLGNLHKQLDAKTLTEWLKSKNFEVPIPLKVVQQLMMHSLFLIPSAPTSKN